ncbi:DNA-directed RNA polymerase subunit delta [Thermoactinomyces sp. CICC 24226]|jgi:DNA-directed RNA polymerase subunit delta|nr:DNA-directed RNA polymerase subunit delta [Thermoactinomyces sp. CICC 10735]MBH8586183.1 DNA-directed RNA polymerase subunit delta [Thermoactinomyces sp. CICC 10520]MBI0392189.1 DNA-directed RNA polymerase subunit delta [Thermoactinomyces sp. CICC 24226]QBK13045.1 DNA-directed RNA polymerase subunit delta [Thermoactinomyces vulgaris]
MCPNLSDNLAVERVRETAMVDLAYDLLKQKGEAMLYRDIMGEVSSMKGFTKEEAEHYIAQLYTEINIDGRFVCVGRNLWGLREWYPTDQATDSAVAANVKEDDEYHDLDEELFDEEEEELGEIENTEDEFAMDEEENEFDDGDEVI